MMSAEYIRQLQDEAAYRAFEEGQTPLVPWHTGELSHAPYLGDYVPEGWRTATWADVPLRKPRGSDWWNGDQACLFVDSSGWGDADEPAITFGEADTFVTRLLDVDGRTWGVGIVQAGQFQVYIGLYIKDDGAPAVNVPGRPDSLDDEEDEY